jgi:DNA-binding NtrC family response regulator
VQVAEAIHAEGKDAKKPCVHLNIGSLELIHLRKLVELAAEKREFYNPVAPDHGNFKLVDGATLIIEDIERSGLAAQKWLCDFLSFCRKDKLHVRILMLAQVPLPQSVKGGSVIHRILEETKRWETIKIPPLRDRKEDIPDLVEFFVRQVAGELGMDHMVIDSNAIGVLVRQEWKENDQELKRMIERSLVLAEDKEVFRLPSSMINEQAELERILNRIEEGIGFALDDAMEIIEKGVLLRALEKFSFNQSRAANFLKITEDTLRYRMKRLGIPTARK